MRDQFEKITARDQAYRPALRIYNGQPFGFALPESLQGFANGILGVHGPNIGAHYLSYREVAKPLVKLVEVLHVDPFVEKLQNLDIGKWHGLGI